MTQTYSIPALAAGVAHLVHRHALLPTTPRWLRVALSGCGAGLAVALTESAELEGTREALRVTQAILDLLPTSGPVRSAVSRLRAMLMVTVTTSTMGWEPIKLARYADAVSQLLDLDALEVACEVDEEPRARAVSR